MPKVNSDNTKFSSLLIMKLLLNVNMYLKVFPLDMLSAWVKHQIVDINIQGFS